MKRILLFVIMIPVSLGIMAQEIADGVFWVYFKDKQGNGYQIDQPSQFLSERSLNRRA